MGQAKWNGEKILDGKLMLYLGKDGGGGQHGIALLLFKQARDSLINEKVQEDIIIIGNIQNI